MTTCNGHLDCTVQEMKRSFRESTVNFFRGFINALKFSPFLKLCLATFMVFNGFMLVASFQAYVIIYYVFFGDQSLGAQYAGWVD
jgi:GPH family glycoside/pentoside/hexuronide:cation symporter